MESNKTLPAISIVAPMYNVEKYVSQCLESVLRQTFKDFEFIITDDCSTDNSVNIVESYIPKFEGRLRLVRLKKNSGGAVVPRNTGLSLSRGKYIALIDTDDLYTDSALEELYNIAEETQADIVATERYYEAKTNDDIIDSNTPLIKKTNTRIKDFVDKPAVVSDDMAERVKDWTNRRFSEYPWDKLYRRDFIIENNIRFPQNMRVRDDTVFSFYCICLADKIVRVPNIINIYRMRTDSLSNDRIINKLDKYLNKWLTDIIEFVRNMEAFMNNFDFFVKNPQYKYMPVYRYIQEELFHHMSPLYNKFKPYQIDSLLRKEFSAKPDENSALMTYIFSLTNMYKQYIKKQENQITSLQKQIEELKKQIPNNN
ncbi:MAG: glycosyltransferase [Selenomonadaceae bacterium]|nr:glycosyltransferase [Selenomonadaceae bacterium]